MNSLLQKLQPYCGGALLMAERITSNRAEAEELLQESLLKASASRRKPSEEKALKVWFFTIVRNQCIDLLRGRVRLEGDEQLAHTPAAETANPDTALEVQQRFAVIKQAFARLSLEQREILSLKDLNGFSYEEIAEILKLNRGTVMSRLHRARLALRDELIHLKEVI